MTGPTAAPAFLAVDRPPTDYNTLLRAIDEIGSELAAESYDCIEAKLS